MRTMHTARPDVNGYLERYEADLLLFFRRHGEALAGYEEAEDLLHGLRLRLLRTDADIVYLGHRQMLGLLYTAARRHLASRMAYWGAACRNPGGVMRITEGSSSSRGVHPHHQPTGPATRDDRRVRARRLLRGLALLKPRDRIFVEHVLDDHRIEDTAEELGLTYDAAQRGRRRALERLRMVVEALRSA